jgi:Protein of unknown function (DUF2934)
MTDIRKMEWPMQQSLENQIRERAYHLWEAGGYQDGAADQHWLAAEREVLASFAASTSLRESPAPSKTGRKTTKPRRRAA